MAVGMVQAAAFPYQVPADPAKKLVTTGEQFGQMLRQLWDHKIRYFDHETSGLEWYLDARSCGIGFGVMEQGRPQSWYVPFRHLTSETQLDIARINTPCRQLFADPHATWVAHHLKFDDHMNRREGWRIVGKRYCTQVAARLYDENNLLGLEKRIVSDLGGDPEQVLFWKRRVLAEVAALAKARKMNITPYKQAFGYAEVSPTLLGHYACHDIEWVALLHTFYETWGLSSYFSRIWATEMQLNEDLTDMEEHGQPIDVEYIGALKERLHHVTSTLEGEVTRQVRSTFGWRNFDPSKDSDVRKLIFGWLEVQPYKKTKAGRQSERFQLAAMRKQGKTRPIEPNSAHWSVDREVLEGCRHIHPMMDSLITWREAHKIQTTWTDSILNKCDAHNILHGSFKQEGTTSGRLSSEGPNLQNFIHDSDKRALAHSGKKLEEGGVDPWSIRRAFIMRDANERVNGVIQRMPRLSFDFSQIELRVLTWYTREPNMLDTYMAGGDIHKRTQDEIEALTGRRPSRRLAKIIAFGLVYGLTERGLAMQAGISEAEAEFFLNAFFQQYTGITPYRIHFWNESRMRGNRCMNIFGRVRTINYLDAKEGWLRGRAERQLFGALIQGTAGELTKESIVRVGRWIKETGSEARLVSTIHDEISLDCPVRELTTVVPAVKCMMETFPELDPIPIIVDGKYSTHNWAENQALPSG